MTYANAKKAFLNNNTDEDVIFTSSFIEKLLKEHSLPKVILSVGKSSSEVSSFMYSILKSANKSVTICREEFAFEPYEKFSSDGKYINPNLLAKYVEFASKKNFFSKKTISLILGFLYAESEKSEYLIFECNNIDYYNNIITALDVFPILILFSSNIDNLLLPRCTRECVMLSGEENFDYISSIFEKSGTHISLTASNKITTSKASAWGFEFYYLGELFSIKATEKEALLSACLAIEGARALNIPRACIFQGLRKAVLPFSFDFYSRSPIIILKAIKENESKEEILNSISQAKMLLGKELMTFSSFDCSDYKYDNSTYLRKNISCFIKENKDNPILFVDTLHTISKIKKELALIK